MIGNILDFANVRKSFTDTIPGALVPGTADLLLHPHRLRIVQALMGRDRLTTTDLRRLLPDVPTATLYRQVTVLLEGGILEVVEERQARGAVERTLALVGDRAVVTPEEAAAMTVEDHRRAFLTFVAGLLADFDRYLDGESPDLMRDLVGYRQVALHLSDEELMEMIGELNAAIAPRLELGPGPGRRRRIFTTLLMPDDGEPLSGGSP
jgi:DNA-binding transcriptional ArsR family regulator